MAKKGSRQEASPKIEQEEEDKVEDVSFPPLTAGDIIEYDTLNREYFDTLSPGFRFVPTGEEVIRYYLNNKILNLPLPLPRNIIRDVNVYGYHPHQLANFEDASDAPVIKKDDELELEVWILCKEYQKNSGAVDNQQVRSKLQNPNDTTSLVKQNVQVPNLNINLGLDGDHICSNISKPNHTSSHSISSSNVPDLSSNEAACKGDPDLSPFDSMFQDKTNRVFNTLTSEIEIHSQSIESLREVTHSLLQMNQDVVRVFLDCKKDVLKSRKLFTLVEDYFENSSEALDLITIIMTYLTRARESQKIIQVALMLFEQEKGEGAKIYPKTLHQWKKLKAAGNPFSGDELFSHVQSACRQQVLMMAELQAKSAKIYKKLRSVRRWRRASNVIFAASFIGMLICTVVAAAVAAPPFLTALAATSTLPLGTVGRFYNSIWKRYGNELKGRREMIISMQVGTYIMMSDLDNARLLMDGFETVMEETLNNADFASLQEEEGAGDFSVTEIKKKLTALSKTIEDLSNHAKKCSLDIKRARSMILHKIINNPSES